MSAKPILKAILLAYFLSVPFFGWSQSYPLKGQYPATAFPVCGADIINQGAVPNGLSSAFTIPGCDPFLEINPFYYRFTCFAPGTLGFIITPNLPADNYDWMLFDFTGVNPSLIYQDSSRVVIGNRSQIPGNTGASITGTSNFNCAAGTTDNISTFTKMPNLLKGHEYLLLVTHPSGAQSGYSLAFTGGTAIINDPELPDLLSVVVSCDRKTLTVGITKFILCNSLAPDGSDFSITNYSGTITQAVGLNCSPQFDMDYLELSLSDPLPPGDFSLVVKNGTDQNTLLDYCGLQAIVGDKLDFKVSGMLPTLDSLIPPSCQPSVLHLVFASPVKCSSIAADGSDFIINGNSGVIIAKADAVACSGNLTNQIDLILTSPITAEGNYQVEVVSGSDGNTITNECDNSIVAGTTLPFTIGIPVSAAFDYKVAYGCKEDTIHISYNSANGVTQSAWYIDSVFASSLLDPELIESVFGSRNVQHIVSNGFCSDTVNKIIDLDNILKASFTAPDQVCPKNEVAIMNTSVGNIIAYNWNFGDGTSSSDPQPPNHLFPDTREAKYYLVSLVIQDDRGCELTASKVITKLQTCNISVPNAFTPNGDGKNDWLYPLNANGATNLRFQVFNRYGQLVFETRDWTKKWDGRMNGQLQETGTYIWILNFADDSGKKFSQRGTTVLIR